MSIATEITRLQNAKAAIKTAIEGKGVTVPDATLMDGMAALIDAIEAGGGGGGEATGTFTVTDTFSTSNVTVTHNLGRSPAFIGVWPESAPDLTGKGYGRFGSVFYSISNSLSYRVNLNGYNNNATINYSTTTSLLSKITENAFVVSPQNALMGGTVYRWVVF